MQLKYYNNYINEMAGVDEDEEDMLAKLYRMFVDLRNNKLFEFHDNIIDVKNGVKINYDDSLNYPLNDDIDFFELVNLHEQNNDSLLKKIINNNISIEELQNNMYGYGNMYRSIVELILDKNNYKLTDDYIIIPLEFIFKEYDILYIIIQDSNHVYHAIKSIFLKSDVKLMSLIKYNEHKKLDFDELNIKNTTNIRNYMLFFMEELYNQKPDLTDKIHTKIKQTLNAPIRNNVFSDFEKITDNIINYNNFFGKKYFNYVMYELNSSVVADIKNTIRF